MAAVTISSGFGAQGEGIGHYFHLSPFYLPCSNGIRCYALSCILIFSLTVAFSTFTHIKRLVSASWLSALRVVSSAYLRLLMFLPPILIAAYNSSSLAFLMMCSACRLNKQGDSRQPCRTPFLILNQSVVPYRILTVAF